MKAKKLIRISLLCAGGLLLAALLPLAGLLRKNAVYTIQPGAAV